MQSRILLADSSVISSKNARQYTKYCLRFLIDLTKNLLRILRNAIMLCCLKILRSKRSNILLIILKNSQSRFIIKRCIRSYTQALRTVQQTDQNREAMRVEFITLEHVVKEYRMGEVTITAAADISFEIRKGEFAIIVGPSGAGKTTVLNLLGGMDACTAGSIVVDGTDVSKFNAKQLTEYRRHDIGFVFQFYNLVQNLTAKENVELAAQICRDPMDAEEVLQQVGLSERMNNFPGQLSGGEQQRVAIARALAKRPKLLLCDEPTGALDYVTGKAILKLLQDTCRERGVTVVVITHNTALTPMADRVIHIKSGLVSKIEENANPTPVEQIEW